MKTVSEYLKQLGLSEIEAKLYLGLLEMGSTTVMELANHVGIKRITAHFNIESLIAKGLVTESRKGARRQIVAEQPYKLEGFLEDREVELQNLKQTLPTIIDSIRKTIPKHSKQTEMDLRYYEGKKAVWSVYEDILKADEVRSFINIDKFYSVFPGTDELFKDAFDKNTNRHFWAIAVDTPLARSIDADEKDKYARYHCKFISPTQKNTIFNFANLIEYQIYNDTVAIIQSDNDSVFATVINSPLIYQSFESLHSFMWELLENKKS